MRGYESYDDRHRYDRRAEEYEDYDYEGEGYGEEEGGDEYEEEEVEEEEDPRPRKDTLEYLELRQRLKEQFRKEMKRKECASRDNSNGKRKRPHDNFGSFFGPSQPVIAPRVIQESKSFLETQHLQPRVASSAHPSKKSSGSSGSKPGTHNQRPKVIDEQKSKVQKLKDTRDYSFLLSDDAELPAPAKDRPPRNDSVAKTEVRSSQMTMKSRQPLENNGRPVDGGRDERKPVSFNGGRDERKPVSFNGGRDVHSRVGSNKPSSASSRPGSTSVDSRKQLGSNSGNGPGRPLGPKDLHSRNPASTSERRASSTGLKNPLPGSIKAPSSKLHSSVSKQPLQQRKEVREPNKPNGVSKQSVGPSKQPINKPQMNRQMSSRPISQEYRPKPISQEYRPKPISQEYRRKPLSQEYRPKPISQEYRPKPISQEYRPKPISQEYRPKPISQEYRPKKVPASEFAPDEYDPEAGDIRSMIRSMMNYNPNKYADSDDDISDMEADFDTIQMEEERSRRIGKKEDEEQARLIEEEERRERLAAKMRKQKKGRLQ